MFLQFSYQHIFQTENGGRPSVPDILILLTDGTQSKVQGAEDPATIAEEIRLSGIHMIVIGESSTKLILRLRCQHNISVFLSKKRRFLFLFLFVRRMSYNFADFGGDYPLDMGNVLYLPCHISSTGKVWEELDVRTKEHKRPQLFLLRY